MFILLMLPKAWLLSSRLLQLFLEIMMVLGDVKEKYYILLKAGQTGSKCSACIFIYLSILKYVQ